MQGPEGTGQRRKQPPVRQPVHGIHPPLDFRRPARPQHHQQRGPGAGRRDPGAVGGRRWAARPLRRRRIPWYTTAAASPLPPPPAPAGGACRVAAVSIDLMCFCFLPGDVRL